MNNEEKPYISQVIQYDRDIAPYMFIRILAGVGSGKNTFADNLVKGNIIKNSDGTTVAPKSVLLITSRRSKANEQRSLKDIEYDDRIGKFDDSYRYYFDDEYYYKYESSKKRILPDFSDGAIDTEICDRSCCCTNAQIQYFNECYSPSNSLSMLWYRFDLIIIDEVHELIADSTYQDSPFYVRRLLEMAVQSDSECKVIVMTGTPEILDTYLPLESAHTLDLMDVCKNNTPKTVIHIRKGKVFHLLCKLLADGERAIYFSNTIREINSYLRSVPIKDYSAGIAASFSEEAKRSALKAENSVVYSNTDTAEKTLAAEKLLPDRVKLFFSTSRNKEGINIKNSDIRTMFVESHAQVDIVQMAGRLREGLDTLYIIGDSTIHESSEIDGELVFTAESNLIQTVNERLCQLMDEVGYNPDDELADPVVKHDRINDYIKFIHKKFDYIRFDYYSCKFVFYSERELGRRYYEAQERAFIGADTKSALIKLTRVWFPNAQVKVDYGLETDKIRSVKKYIEGQHLVGRTFRDDGEEKIISDLKKLTGDEFSLLSPYLKKFGYKVERKGNYAKEPRKIVRLYSRENSVTIKEQKIPPISAS